MAATSNGPSIGHLVLTVRDIEASHRFYTTILGFEQCGTFENASFPDVDMRFYRGSPDHHHDLALVQSPDPSANPPPTPFDVFGSRVGINHIAIEYPDRATFVARLQHLQDNGVETIMRLNHGMTHSAYIQDPDGNGIEVHYTLPSEVWEGDINSALNYTESLPSSGAETLDDSVEYVRFSTAPQPDEMEAALQARLEALPPAARAELIHVLRLPDLDRVDRVGEFWGHPETRTSGELLIDLEEDGTLKAVI